MAWIMCGFFVFVTFIFIVIAVFFPEVVGITGKKALQIQREQQEESTLPPPTPSEDPGTID
ncbi:MAG: hypothetical protein ACK5P7_09130 [Bdellovibrio sp.]|jgi:hypothetical protein